MKLFSTFSRGWGKMESVMWRACRSILRERRSTSLETVARDSANHRTLLWLNVSMIRFKCTCGFWIQVVKDLHGECRNYLRESAVTGGNEPKWTLKKVAEESWFLNAPLMLCRGSVRPFDLCIRHLLFPFIHRFVFRMLFFQLCIYQCWSKCMICFYIRRARPLRLVFSSMVSFVSGLCGHSAAWGCDWYAVCPWLDW